MFSKYARRLLLAAAALPIVAAALPGRAAADLPAPTVALQQQGLNVVANWTSAVSYDSYNVKWTARGRPGGVTLGGGAQGTVFVGQFVRGTDVIFQMQGVLSSGGVSPWSDPQQPPFLADPSGPLPLKVHPR